MSRIIWALALSAAILGGCKPPSERFEGPGASRLQPVVHGGTRFGDDRLAIPIETMARTEEGEPHILRVELYADGERLPAPGDLRVERWQGKYGYAQRALFTAPAGARRLKAVLFVQHGQNIFQMDVPFELDPAGRSTNKWIMGKESVGVVGAASAGRANSRPAA
jgi:hypothetical protein